MCSHNFKKINDIKACIKCGLIITYNGKAFYDKALIKYVNTKKRRCKR